MKVMIISPNDRGIGGIEQHVTNLRGFLEQKDSRVEMLSSSNTPIIPIRRLKNPSFMVTSSIKSMFKKGFDIVHAHNLPSAQAMRSARDGKKILTLHGVYAGQIGTIHGKAAGGMAARYEKVALGWADAITAVSKEAQAYYSELGFDVRHIPNAIDIESLGFQRDRKYQRQIVFAGRLSKEKGTDILYEIAKAVPDSVDLIILGSGPDEGMMRKISRPNVHVLGYQPRKRTIEIIRGSDMLIRPSYHEAVSTTILESMACGVPVVTTNIPGTSEVLTDGKTGILLENSAANFLDAIDMLYSDSNMRDRIVSGASELVKRYDWKHVGQMYLDLYGELV